MGKQVLRNNYRAVIADEIYEFYAVSDRQAWYLAYEWADSELLDALYELNIYGEPIRELLERED